ncbi:alpha/beta hydrolase [Pseudomonas sp. COR58]|uniref:Alpha/beta hydrolase n=1 Tax=Pseudomonas ekonensis TaxID=2842353 RepID=A0ABS6PIT6_9PSED|nr:alpha/beta hydrolase [Pseudomonas ekonensis]MBV4460114.1 alpha/beta hydrolase [Pseudomonas ekonensis]
MSEPTRPVPTQIGPDGNVTARVTMSPSANTVRAELNAPPDHAIPVIFVPGIMGSPLMSTGPAATLLGEDNRWAWFPDDPKGWIAGLTRWKSYNSLTPLERKQLLDPQQTRAFSAPEDADRETLAKFVNTLPVQEARNRGWGSVSLDSYGPILNFLEAQLRFIQTPEGKPYPGVMAAVPHSASIWGDLKGYSPLKPEALKAAAEFRYPVYAVGYNWLNSNAQAADYLAGKIRATLERCRKELNVKCEHGVILVTHSMGGLVARMCAKRNPELIQGVVHGVQPAIGAATAYRRVRAGWEDFKGAVGLGGTGKKIMPIFANAAGPLELLPNQRYGEGWLRATCDGKELFRMPNGTDPYTQIYLKQNAWWRLMNAAWINPTGNTTQATLVSAWSNYERMLGHAKAFHASLGDYYHPNSFVHYGSDPGHQAFHRVTWAVTPGFIPSGRPGVPPTLLPAPSREQAIALRLTGDTHEGRAWMVNDVGEKSWINRQGSAVIHDSRGDGYRADIQDQDQAGDGTVPAHAAEDAAEKAVFAARMTGYDHQGSYKNRNVQNLTLYSVLRIGATARKLPA